MGGTRFVGKALVQTLIEDRHEITLFTRGNKPVPKGVTHIRGDRNTDSIDKLSGLNFDVIVDSSGRTCDETSNLIKITGKPAHRFVYISSAGVYANNELYPYTEQSEIDINSRHYGKVETENWLLESKIPFTSFRPTYIYGPGNYNPIEKWFFDRIINNKIVPIPDDGQLITQLGHVQDLASAIKTSLSHSIAANKIYNCSGISGITIKGLVESAGNVCGIKSSNILYKSFDTKLLNNKSRKLYPIRLNHFLTDISLIRSDLNWIPKYDLIKGLEDSYHNDYLLNIKDSTNYDKDLELFE